MAPSRMIPPDPAAAAGDPPADLRARILDVTIPMIESQGETGLRVLEIAAAVGIGVTSLYRLFGSRDGLIEAAQAERYVRTMRMPIEATRSVLLGCLDAEDVREGLRLLVSMSQLESGVYRRVVRTSVLASALTRPNLGRMLEDIHRTFVDEFTHALEPLARSGVIRSELDLTSFSFWFMGVMDGRILQDIYPESFPAKQWEDMALRALFSVLFPENDPASRP